MTGIDDSNATYMPLMRQYRLSPMCGKIRMISCKNNNAVHEEFKGKDDAVMRPCRVSLERYQIPSSAVSIVWNVKKEKLVDQTVQLVFMTVRVDGHGEEVTVDNDTRNICKNKKEISEFNSGEHKKKTQLSSHLKSQAVMYSENHINEKTCAQFGVSRASIIRWRRNVGLSSDSSKTEDLKSSCISGKDVEVKEEVDVINNENDGSVLIPSDNDCEKIPKFSGQFKSQVVAYSLTHSVKGACAQFGVCKRSIVLWRRNERFNNSSRSEEFKLNALTCLKKNGKLKTSRIFKVPVSTLCAWQEEFDKAVDVTIQDDSDFAQHHRSSPNTSFPLLPIIPVRYVMTNLPQDRAKLKDIWEMLVAPEYVAGEEIYSCLSCDKRFRGKSAKYKAWSHVDHNHTPHIDHKCHVCDFISMNNDGLSRHISKIHKML